jgi:predicted XRE-type DNA-binding protein
MAKRRETVEIGSENVFRDLGRTEAGERQLRTRLAMKLNELIAREGLTQGRVAERFGIPQPHISELKHYKLSRFSSERLLRFLTLLDHDVEIVIRPKASRRAAGRLSVSAA